VRVTVPRALPTDDVLVVRKTKGKGKGESSESRESSGAGVEMRAWTSAATLDVIADRRTPDRPSALVLSSLDDVRWAADRAAALSPNLRAIVAVYIPSGTVPLFAGLGIAAFSTDDGTLKALAKAQTLSLPEPSAWQNQAVIASAGGQSLSLKWNAVGAERAWTTHGTAASQEPRA
jgi:aconitate hydratase